MKKSSGSRSRKQRLTAVGTRCADHVTPIYPQKLALTSPTGGGRSVGIVRVRTKATEFSLYEVMWKNTVEPYKATGANIVRRRKGVIDMHAAIQRQEYTHTQF